MDSPFGDCLRTVQADPNPTERSIEDAHVHPRSSFAAVHRGVLHGAEPMSCQPKAEFAGDAAIAAILSAWDGVCVYDTMGRGIDDEVLVIGHKGSTYLFCLVASDGSRTDVTDATSQQFWLEDVLSGRLPLIWSPSDSRQPDLI